MFLSLDKCVLVPLLEDHIICDCAGILQGKEVLSNYNLQSQPEKKKMRCQLMSVNVFPVGATCWSTPKIVPWTPDAIHILLLLAVTEVVPPYY